MFSRNASFVLPPKSELRNSAQRRRKIETSDFSTLTSRRGKSERAHENTRLQRKLQEIAGSWRKTRGHADHSNTSVPRTTIITRRRKKRTLRRNLTFHRLSERDRKGRENCQPVATTREVEATLTEQDDIRSIRTLSKRI